jgi:hypothetical protein
MSFEDIMLLGKGIEELSGEDRKIIKFWRWTVLIVTQQCENA